MEYKLIQVKYLNSKESFVDDVTLDELILLNKIRQFYRPSQEKWIDIQTDPVRIRERHYGGSARRVSDNEEEVEQLEEKPRDLLSRLFRRNIKPIAQKKALTADDWFERGFLALYTLDDDEKALRAFAKTIYLDPTNQRAYFNRGITYERVGNLHQAIDDFSKAIELAPRDAKVYYVCGFARKRLGMEDEAMEDFKKAARLGYSLAINYLKSKDVSF